MSQDSRPPKRQRGIDDIGRIFPLEGLKRSEEFWLPDGNIVLVAGEVAFRVYRGLLAMQSTVFADTFASSSPSAEEVFDGCPVIRLTDSATDLAHLLRVLLPTSRPFLHRRRGDPDFSFKEIYAIVRLTHKYQIDDLLGQALSSLTDCYPSSFKEYESDFDGYVDLCGVDAIAAVNLARLTDTPSLLPLALYKCCDLGAALLDGWQREDGTVEHIAPEDLRRCVSARDALAKEAFSLVSAIFQSEVSEDCGTQDRCEVALRNVLVTALVHEEVAEADVLRDWIAIIEENAFPASLDGYCPTCEKELLARDRRERERVWNRLPEIFDVEVEDWNQDEDQETDSDSDGEDGEE